jgi:hypothetical protein
MQWERIIALHIHTRIAQPRPSRHPLSDQLPRAPTRAAGGSGAAGSGSSRRRPARGGTSHATSQPRAARR